MYSSCIDEYTEPYMILSLILGFVLGAAAIVFAFQNTTIVALSFLGWQFQSSLALLVVLSLLAGGLLSMLLSFPAAIRDRVRMYSLRKENDRLAEALTEAQRRQVQVVETYSSQPVAAM